RRRPRSSRRGNPRRRRGRLPPARKSVARSCLPGPIPGAALAPACLDPLGRRLVKRRHLALVRLLDADGDFPAQLFEPPLVDFVALAEEAKPLADDLAGRLVQAALDLPGHELFEFRGKRNVHVFASSGGTSRRRAYRRRARNVNSCYQLPTKEEIE